MKYLSIIVLTTIMQGCATVNYQYKDVECTVIGTLSVNGGLILICPNTNEPLRGNQR